MHNLLFSTGSLFFSLLLTIVYFVKSKQTKIDNKVFKLMLIILNLTVISEIVAVATIYYYPTNVALGNLLARINWILTISWIMNIACYILTIDTANEIKNFKSFIQSSNSIKLLLYIYIASVIISLFIEFNNFANEKGAYIAGPALYFMYIIGFIAILTSAIGVIKSGKKVPKEKTVPLVIGIIVSITAMVLQRIFPMYLMLTSMFTFDTYIIYFIFENPDLFLIKEFDLAKKKAENSDRAKTDFLSNMSKEIRTPINTIIGLSEGVLLDNEFSSEIVKKDAKNILSAGNSLLEAINNIIDISEAEADEMVKENKEYNLKDIVIDINNIIKNRLNESKVEFIVDVDPKTPTRIIGDRNKLFQILLNILSNSVKYTEIGRIKLHVDSDIQNNEIMLHFKISDTGYGIKNEYYDKLFSSDSNLDTITREEIEKTGLGLIITKKLVDILEGKIWFESEYGAGTTFYVSIPQKLSGISEFGQVILNDVQTEKREYLDCSNKKVLLVDDNILNLKVEKRILSNYKFDITCITNGNDCINDIKKGNTYDLIFIDNLMPEIDGIELIHVLKKIDGYKFPPVIMTTANTSEDMKEICFKAGFDDYLFIPIRIAELDNIIRKHLNK